MTGFGEEEEEGIAAAACLLAYRAESAQNTLLNLDWWTSRYRLGYAMGGGDGWRGPGKAVPVEHWPAKP